MTKYIKKIKYPKLILFGLSILLAVTVFYEGMTSDVLNHFITSTGYIGIFLGGFLYSYGFTSTSATAVLLIIAKESSLIISILIAGLGALVGDILIFLFAKKSLLKELTALKEEKHIVSFKSFLKKKFGLGYKYIVPIIAGILIMTPLPTEIGVTMLATRKNLSMRKFMFIAYLLHTMGIAIILTVGNLF